jgi:transcription elongation factor GreA
VCGARTARRYSIKGGVSLLMEAVLTAEGFEKLNAEHVRLRAERETIVERLRSALEFGGAFPENGEYLDARHELELVDRRLLLLEERLFGAEIVDPLPDGAVDLGERVTVLDLESGEASDYRVVGTGESNPMAGEISRESPVGSALLGRRVGDVVEADAPSATAEARAALRASPAGAGPQAATRTRLASLRDASCGDLSGGVEVEKGCRRRCPGNGGLGTRRRNEMLSSDTGFLCLTTGVRFVRFDRLIDSRLSECGTRRVAR